jgi:hypothetical protein
MRPTDKAVYHGRALGESEMTGPAMIFGAPRASRAPANSPTAIKTSARPSPQVKERPARCGVLNENVFSLMLRRV